MATQVTDVGFCWNIVVFYKLYLLIFSPLRPYPALGRKAAESTGHSRLHVEVSSCLAPPWAHLQLWGHRCPNAWGGTQVCHCGQLLEGHHRHSGTIHLKQNFLLSPTQNASLGAFFHCSRWRIHMCWWLQLNLTCWNDYRSPTCF